VRFYVPNFYILRLPMPNYKIYGLQTQKALDSNGALIPCSPTCGDNLSFSMIRLLGFWLSFL
jgi:hypothetical protein